MLSLEKLSESEKKTALANTKLGTGVYRKILVDFLNSGEEIAKITGYSSTDAYKVYGVLAACSNKEMKDSGVRVRKRRENIYLINTNINPIGDAPEKR